MRKYSLIEAVVIIANQLKKSIEDITAIQFEDGSGKCFNYQINGSEWKFIRLTK